jgi:hypothetical protein
MRQTKKDNSDVRAVPNNGFTIVKNEKNRLRWVVLGLSQDGACIDLFENHSENSLKEGLSNITTFNPPLFSLLNTVPLIQKLAKIFNNLRMITSGKLLPDVVDSTEY